MEHNQQELGLAKKRRRAADVWTRGLSRSTYSTLLVIFTVVEVPLNYIAFQSFFSEALSMIIGLGVSVAIIFLAHIAGLLLVKRETELVPRRRSDLSG